MQKNGFYYLDIEGLFWSVFSCFHFINILNDHSSIIMLMHQICQSLLLDSSLFNSNSRQQGWLILMASLIVYPCQLMASRVTCIIVLYIFWIIVWVFEISKYVKLCKYSKDDWIFLIIFCQRTFFFWSHKVCLCVWSAAKISAKENKFNFRYFYNMQFYCFLVLLICYLCWKSFKKGWQIIAFIVCALEY